MSDKKLNDTQEIAIISDNGNSDVNVIIENHTEINNHPSVDTSNVINLSTHPIPSSSSSSQNVRIEDVTEQNINDLNGIHITPHLTRRTSTETHSINSNNVSIKTLDENDHSSVSDSDSDVENVNMNESDFQSASNGMVLVNNSIDPKKLSQSNILCTNNETSKANIGSIAIQNSSDITFGDKTFINGPVTIKQFLMDEGTNKWKKSDGFENPAFSNSADDVNQRNGCVDTKDHPDEIVKKWKWTSKQALMTTIVAGICLCILSVTIMIMKLNEETPGHHSNKIGDGDDSRLNIPMNSTIASDLISDTSGPLRVVTRSDWIAQPPADEMTDLELPAERVIIAHTATDNCSTQAICTLRVRLIQTYHIESRGWSDIGYNFLAGGDGAIYVGRGWNKQGAHTKGYNVKSICFAFIGTFNKDLPPQRQLTAVQNMIKEGIKLKKLSNNYKLYGHRQLMASESPGAALYEVIKKWDHWSDVIAPLT